MAYDNTNTCAVWKKKTKNGDVYVSVSGTTASGESFSFNCFKNDFKTEDKHPDFRSAKDKDEKPAKQPAKSSNPFDDDAPF